MADTVGTVFQDGKFWTPERDAFALEKARLGWPRSRIAEAMGTSKSAVAGRLHRLGIQKKSAGRPWTDADDSKLLSMWADGRTALDCSAALKRGEEAIGKRLKKLRATLPAHLAPAKRDNSDRPQNNRFIMNRKATFSPHERAVARRAAEAAPSTRYAQLPKPHMAGMPLERLGTYQCRYACNDARIGEQHLFCGAKCSEGKRYCADHEPMMRRAA